MSMHEPMKKLGVHLGLLAVLAVVLFPMFAIVMVSLDPKSAIGSNLIPQQFTLNHWRYVLGIPYVDGTTGVVVKSAFPMMLWLANSLKISFMASLGMILLATTSGYALSKLKFSGKKPALITVMIIQMFPNVMALVAFYVLLDHVGELFPALGTDTHWGLILVYLGGTPFNIWLTKGYFDTIPRSLEEAAYLDGCSRWQTFVKIILPLSAPILAVIGLLTFIGTFSDFIIPSVLLKSQDKLTFAVGIQIFIAESFSSRWGPFAAACLIGALPIVAIFLSIHRFVVSGLASGATKG